jgi:hypothetical protein
MQIGPYTLQSNLSWPRGRVSRADRCDICALAGRILDAAVEAVTCAAQLAVVFRCFATLTDLDARPEERREALAA